MQLHCAETAERIDAMLVVETLGDPMNIVLDRSPNSPPPGDRFDAAFAKLIRLLADM